MQLIAGEPWFKSWFNSPYYPLLYKERNDAEAGQLIDKLVSFLKITPNQTILDLGCGRGRHAIYLANKGFNVTGVDISEESIKQAQEFENDHLEFFIHDMRKPLRINYFNYVFNLFSSFGYFENDRDNYKTVKYAAQSLKPGGQIVIDFMNAKKVIESLVPEETRIENGIVFKINRSVENGFIVKKINIDDNGKREFFEERVKALSPDDFEKYISNAGLQTTHLFGDYDLSTFDIQKSERLIIIAQKN